MTSFHQLTVHLASAAPAGEERQPAPAHVYKGFGLASHSCGAFLEETAKSDTGSFMREFHKMWLAGFLTGVGLVYSITQRLEVTADVDVEGAAAWIEKHCREYPLDPFAKAVNLLAAHIVNRARPADAQQQAAPENR